jgi:hypothetical protein
MKKEIGDLVNIALDNLSLGRAWMMKTLQEKSDDSSRAMDFLNEAVTGLKESERDDFLPRALFARAECYRYQNEITKAQEDLKEAKEIAAFGNMKMYICDYYMEMGRLCMVKNKNREAKRRFKSAAKLVKEMGYWRRRRDLE